MQEPILVTGGTGTLGSLVVERLLDAGHQVRAMSRRSAAREDRVVADLLTGEGVDAAVRGTSAVVHCATTLNGKKDVRATRTLVEAAQRADCAHLVCVSIVGVDSVPFGYYQGKLAAEEFVERSGVRYTMLRATQFHDLLRVLFAAAARLPVMFVPGFRFQPVDAGEVATRLAELVTGEPLGRAPELAGPEIRHATELTHAYLATTGRRRPVIPVRLPGKVFRAYRDGGDLAPEHGTGRITFEQYLAQHADPARLSYQGGQR